jgi:prevent-host-death family protein
MKSVSAAKVAAQFDEYLEASRQQPVLVTRNGKPVALLLAVDNRAEAEHLAAERIRSLRSIFEEAHAQLEAGQGIPHDQFWREVEDTRSKRGGARRDKR